MRIGMGYDSHRFAPGDTVMIGGVAIPYEYGIEAHSDGDVLLHALVDALLGASALGDIGQHFPDTDARYSNMSSSQFVTAVMQLLEKYHYRVGNVDATVVLELPKLKAHMTVIREHIANLLDVSISEISVKATTNEKMGFIGRGEGLAATVVVTLFPFTPETKGC